MDVYDLLDRYKSQAIYIRILIIVFVGLIPTFLFFESEIHLVELDLESAKRRSDSAEVKYRKGKKKIAQLTGLSSQISEIKKELDYARKVLPDKVQVNSVLAAVGELENEYGVTVVKFEPQKGEATNSEKEYLEYSINIDVSGQFSQVMLFLDGLVHLPNLTHLRDVYLVGNEKRSNTISNVRSIEAKAKLILFRGIL